MDHLPVLPRFEQIELRTARLLLRPLREADATDLLRIYGDPQVTRYLSKPPWTTLEEALASIAQDGVALPRGEYLRLGIELPDEARVIGTCALFHLEWPSRRAELGYCLATDAWGKGYVGEALGALVDYAFEELHLNRLEADVDPRNAASKRVLERLGFRREGLLRERWIVAGHVSDTAIYGLLLREWQARHD
jgi:RimJ/RimL family protein N-acetyltransferase